MGKIFLLIKNELIKQYKKVSFKVIMILIFAVAFIVPFFINKVSSNSEDYIIENSQQEITWQQQEIDSLDKNSPVYDINMKIMQLNIDKLNVYIDNNIGYDDWRRSKVEEYVVGEQMLVVLNAIKSGTLDKGNSNNIYNQDPEIINGYLDMEETELSKEIEKMTSNIKKCKELVEKNDYMAYVAEVIEATKAEASSYKKQLDEAKAEKLKSDSEEIAKTIDGLERSIAVNDEILKALEYRYENKIDNSSDNWKHRTIRDIANYAEAIHEELVSQDDFKSIFSWEIAYQGLTYDNYLIQRENRITDAKERLQMDWYSLENDIPQTKFVSDARSSLLDTYKVYLSIAVVVAIIIGGGIVASEYSTGTVRLLMIRPVSRWKILLSKLMAVVIFGYITLFMGIIVNTISSGIAFSFGDYSVPMLVMKNGEVITKNFFVYLMPNILFISISMIFIISVVFTLSTVIRNTAFAVGITMAGFLGSTTAVTLAAHLGMKWVSKTCLPYINLTNYVDESYIINSLKEMGWNLNPTLGAVHLMAIAVVLIVISFAVFSKRDVTN